MTPNDAISAAAEVLKRWLPSATRHDGRDYFLEIEMLSLLDLTAGFDRMVNLVEKARRGDADADSLLQKVGLQFVSAGAPIPEPLRGYIADHLRDQTKPMRRRGKHRQADLLRNFAITYLIARVAEHGFLATRNRETRNQESACSILAAALVKAGVHMSETGVEKIWNKQERLPIHLREYVAGPARIPTFSPLDSA